MVCKSFTVSFMVDNNSCFSFSDNISSPSLVVAPTNLAATWAILISCSSFLTPTSRYSFIIGDITATSLTLLTNLDSSSVSLFIWVFFSTELSYMSFSKSDNDLPPNTYTSLLSILSPIVLSIYKYNKTKKGESFTIPLLK